jgi:hypothetical protein
LQHAAEVGIAGIGTVRLQGGGQRNKATLIAFNQPFLPLLQLKQHEFDLHERETGFLGNNIGAIVAYPKHSQVGSY